jgi:hypothetical protein
MARSLSPFRTSDFPPATQGYFWPTSGVLPDARCGVLTGHKAIGYPAAGGDIDGVTGIFTFENGNERLYFFTSSAGQEMKVELAASASAGAELETLADGRVKPRSTGKPILRALESGAAGSLIWCVVLSGR